MPSLSAQLADRVLDGRLVELITELRDAGMSWAGLANVLSHDLGTVVSEDTVRRWATDLEADAA